MDGHMWRIGHQIPIGAKNCAGKVEPLFDVYRIGRVGQCGPHLLGNRHKKIIKHLKHDRIDRGANGLGALYRLNPPKNQISAVHSFCLPAPINQIGAGVFKDNRRPHEFLPFLQACAVNERNRTARAIFIELNGFISGCFGTALHRS